MNHDESAWAVLGIAPTDDARAIRQAYAAKLKTIDPESDPHSFIALRDAFETAQMRVDWRAYASGPDGAVEAMESVAPHRTDRSGRVLPVAASDLDQNIGALAALLHAGNAAGGWPSETQKVEMRDLWEVVLADPRMDVLSEIERVEPRLEELLLDTAPFSDPLIVPIVDHYHWRADRGTIRETPGRARLCSRYDTIKMLGDMATPGSFLYPTWQKLTLSGLAGGAEGITQTLRVEHANPSYTGSYMTSDRFKLWGRPPVLAGRAARNDVEDERRVSALVTVIAAIVFFIVFGVILRSGQ